MKCTNCGADLLEGAKFCTKCGTSVAGNIQPTFDPVSKKPQQPLNQTITQTVEPINGQQERFQTVTNEQQPDDYYNNGEMPQTYGKKSSGGMIAAIIVIVVLVIIIVVLGIMILVKNGKSDEAGDSTQNVTEATMDASTEAADKEDTSTETASEKDAEQTGENIFEKIPYAYNFNNGGGATSDIELSADGTFTGHSEYFDYGSSGSGSDFTCYQCDFSGKFSTPKKVDDYTYSMKVEYVDTEGTLNDEVIRDNTKYIITTPFGFEDGEEYMLYLPGAKMSELPESFAERSIMQSLVSSNGEYLDCYGLYEMNGGVSYYNKTYETVSGENLLDNTVSDDTSSEYIISDSDSRILTDADVDGLELWQINYAKNEIYARHGYIFESNELQTYFNSKSWYRPLYAKKEFDSLGLLSSVENKNAAFLSKKEKERGGYKLD